MLKAIDEIKMMINKNKYTNNHQMIFTTIVTIINTIVLIIIPITIMTLKITIINAIINEN